MAENLVKILEMHRGCLGSNQAGDTIYMTISVKTKPWFKKPIVTKHTIYGEVVTRTTGDMELGIVRWYFVEDGKRSPEQIEYEVLVAIRDKIRQDAQASRLAKFSRDKQIYS